MKPPSDDAVILSRKSGSPTTAQAERWILAATILGSSMAFIDSTVVNVALPAIQANLHATVVGVQWVVESYGLLLGALILAGGSLGDLFGRRLMFLAGVGLFAVASVGCGFSSSLEQLVIARSIQGVGAAFLVPGSLSIISALFDEKNRGKAIGTWSGFTALTTAFGPVLGGWLIQHASWRWAFFINVPIAAAVMAISAWRIPESRNAAAGHVDWAGTLLATCGLGGVVYAFIESVNLGWREFQVIGALIVGVACLIVFVLVEAHVQSPMVPMTLFKSGAFTGANMLTLFLYAAIGIFFFLFPLDLIQVQGYSPTVTGASALPLIILVFSLSRWSGGLVVRYGARAPLIVGPLVVGTGFMLFAIPGAGAAYWGSFFTPFVILGLGLAITVAPLTTVVMGAVGSGHAGAASGINNAVARVASVLAIAILGIVMVKLFSSSLNRSLGGELLPPGVLPYIHANETKLAGIELPSGLGADTAAMIHNSISRAFVYGFRMVMFGCAGLSLASAIVAWRMIPAARQ